MVRSAVDEDPDTALAAILGSVSDLRVHLDSAPAAVVIVDIDADPVGILGELELVISSHPATRVVVLSSVFSNELVLEAMQAGARRFLLKESVAGELVPIRLEPGYRLMAGFAAHAIFSGESGDGIGGLNSQYSNKAAGCHQDDQRLKIFFHHLSFFNRRR